MIHTVKGTGILNKAARDVFMELSFFFYESTDAGNLISGFSVFSKSSLNIWKFSVHILLKPGLENFEHYFDSVWDECNCVVVWTFFGMAFLWDCNENWKLTFSSPMATAEFSKFAGTLTAALSQHHLLGFERAQLGFHHSSVGKESACDAGDLGWIPGSGRSSGEGNGNPLQYSCLENPLDW